MRPRIIYLAGSMRNLEIQQTAALLRNEGYEVFDDWFSSGPEADDRWQEYERIRGRSYLEALNGHHARHVFNLDRHHLERCDTFVMQLPCGKSGHIEFGAQSASGKECHILMLEEPDRFDIMYRYAHGIWSSREALVAGLNAEVSNVEP